MRALRVVVRVGFELLRRWLFWDLGAERRGRRAAVAALRDVARDHPEAADFATKAAEVSTLPGD